LIPQPGNRLAARQSRRVGEEPRQVMLQVDVVAVAG
jgi:hypothetical protein